MTINEDSLDLNDLDPRERDVVEASEDVDFDADDLDEEDDDEDDDEEDDEDEE